MEQQTSVFMKKQIKGHRIWENHPRIIWTLLMIAWMVVFFALIFFLFAIECNLFLGILIPFASWALPIWFMVKNNKEKNLTKNSAFVYQNDILYYVEMGYSVNYQTLGDPINIALAGPKFSHDLDVAMQVQTNEKEIRTRRAHAANFVIALNQYLPHWGEPGALEKAGLHSICEMCEPKLEEINEKTFQISYWNHYTKGIRHTVTYPNIYDKGLIETLNTLNRR